MDTQLDEIADGIYRISTFVPAVEPDGLTFNQFLVVADEPLLFHTGLRAMFPSVVAALARVVPVPRLRWISFGHVEADECGAMNLLLSVAPQAEVTFGTLGCQVSVDDLSDRPPRPLAPGEALDLGGRRIVAIPTPHVPHNWEAQVVLEETTGTLLCGDLFTQSGRPQPVAATSPVEAAIEAAARFGFSTPGAIVPTTLRRLATHRPRTLAVMHGSSFEGDAATALCDLADAWELRFGGSEGDHQPDSNLIKETGP